VRWLGHIDDFTGVLAATDVLALSTDYPEGLPLILLEGAAAGCARVASDIAAVRSSSTTATGC
jgi:glycosyltransferase involved in cell wall biosynthesis